MIVSGYYDSQKNFKVGKYSIFSRYILFSFNFFKLFCCTYIGRTFHKSFYLGQIKSFGVRNLI